MVTHAMEYWGAICYFQLFLLHYFHIHQSWRYYSPVMEVDGDAQTLALSVLLGAQGP
jgi:hypothetical protein